MKSQKKQILTAKQMFKKSLSEGKVDTGRVHIVLKKMLSQKPAGLLRILRIYKRLIETAITREQLILESAVETANKKLLEKELLKKTGARKVIYKTNSKITFGARITHGDWIYDETLDAKLKSLTNAQ